jgi:hypothetical protein
VGGECPSKRRDGRLLRITELGVMWPQAKENLEPPEGRRKAPSLRALWPYNTSISDLWSPKLGEKLFLLFKTPRL